MKNNTGVRKKDIRRPNLFIPGAAKSGTSTLHSMLIKHNEISAWTIKEPHTYSWDVHYKKRWKSFRNRYNQLDTQYILESSTSYLVSKYAIKRILKDTPEAKFIILLRDPVDRIISHYNWLTTLGLVNKCFKEEVTNEANKKFNYRVHYSGNYKNYIDFSLYGEQLEYLNSHVAKSQYLILTFEELTNNPNVALEKISSFLKLDVTKIDLEKKNSAFDQSRNILQKDSLLKRISNRMKMELRFFWGIPRSRKIDNPIKEFVKRKDVEDFLISFIEDDYRKLNNLGYNQSNWETSQKL